MTIYCFSQCVIWKVIQILKWVKMSFKYMQNTMPLHLQTQSGNDNFPYISPSESLRKQTSHLIILEAEP